MAPLIKVMFAGLVDTDHPLLVHLPEHVLNVLLLLYGSIEQLESVMDEISFDLRIQSCITIEGWGVIDFQKPGCTVFVHEDVEA